MSPASETSAAGAASTLWIAPGSVEGRAVFPGPGFTDGEFAVVNSVSVQGLDGGLRGFGRCHGYEGKSARASIFAINGHFNIDDGAVRGEHLGEVILGHRMRHVADE
jgi:hypothetical protein